MHKPPKKLLPKQLLVEGDDDFHVICHLAQAHQLEESFSIVVANGVDAILAEIGIRLDEPKLSVLGILIDADDKSKERWTALLNVLLSREYREVPLSPDASGTILASPGKPTFGVWIMPNNDSEGALEDFISYLIPNKENNPLWQHVNQSVAAIPQNEIRFPSARKNKALIHTWLAWQEEPGKPLGQAITAKYMDAQATEAKTLIGWLDRLFNQPYATPVF